MPRRRLPIGLLRDEIDEVYTTAYVAYAGKSMACRGDGEVATRYIDPDSGNPYLEPVTVPCPCDRLEKDEKGNRRCKFNGILHCSLRLPGYAVIGSVYRQRTVSEISVVSSASFEKPMTLMTASETSAMSLYVWS